MWGGMDYSVGRMIDYTITPSGRQQLRHGMEDSKSLIVP
jgi:hypothetical protein